MSLSLLIRHDSISAYSSINKSICVEYNEDEGLFIVVPESRVWFATENQAKICHTEIAFINNNSLHKVVLH